MPFGTPLLTISVSSMLQAEQATNVRSKVPMQMPISWQDYILVMYLQLKVHIRLHYLESK